MRLLIIIALTVFVYWENQKIIERNSKKKEQSTQTAKNQMPVLPEIDGLEDPARQPTDRDIASVNSQPERVRR